MRGERGYTLVEIVVAVMLTAIMVASMMSLVLSSKRGSVKSDHRMIANEACRQLAAMLKGYVTADSAQSTIAGPASTTAGAASWKLPGDSSAYALTCGAHVVNNATSGILPLWFAAAPYNAAISYTVSNCGAGLPPRVDVTVNWTEP